MIKNIVFDLGNVMVYYRPMDWLQEHFQDPAVIEGLMDTVFLSPEWALMDRGMMSDGEACRLYVERRPALASEIRFTMAHWTDMLQPIPGSLGVLERLRGRPYELYYLSNISEQSAASLADRPEFWRSFQGGILSYRELLTKPDPAIYIRLLERCGLEARECLFVDDSAANVEAARSLGFEALLLEDPDGLTGALEACGIL